MEEDDFFCNCKTEARSASIGAAGFVHSVKFFKNSVQLFSRNGFSPVFSNLCIDDILSFSINKSPDFTTDGVMEKFWYLSAGTPYLAKLDHLQENALVANEIVYHKIATVLGLQTTPYFAGTAGDKKYCTCPCFVKDDKTDYISALQIRHMNFSRRGEGLILYFMKDLDMKQQVREMITLDCLLHNTDRHEKNFGFLISEEGTHTFVPLFDNGFCLGANRNEGSIQNYDMRLFPSARECILQNFGISELDIDEKYFLRILEETYSDFSVPERRYEKAKDELQYGINLYKKVYKKELVQLADNIGEKEL